MRPPYFALLALFFAASASAQQFTLFAAGGKSMTSYHGQADLQAVSLEFTERQSKHIEAGVAFGSDLLWQEIATDHERGVHAADPLVVPAQTSHFNFLSYAGAGVVIGPEWSTPLMVGFRLAHVSNAGVAHHNPGMNFSALVAGLRLRH